MISQPAILGFVGPSGVGKSTIARFMIKNDPSLYFSVSATTRKPRAGETEKDYLFLSEEEFVKLIKADAFLEHEQVHGNRYGTLRAPVEKALKSGHSVLMDIDTKGALALKEKTQLMEYPFVTIFLLPPEPHEKTLRERLKGRNSETDEQLEVRIKRALEELDQADLFDVRITTFGDIQTIVDEIYQEVLQHVGANALAV